MIKPVPIWALPTYQKLKELIASWVLVAPIESSTFLLLQNIASSWLCVSQAKKPCGQCVSCRLLTEPLGEHPDLFIMEKEKGNLNVESVRKSIEFLNNPPSISPKRIVLIHGANLLTHSATSALLKTLEEPEPYAHFLLSAPSLSSLLPTIKSRLLHKILPRPTQQESEDFLLEKGFDPKEIKKVLFFEPNAPDRALKLLSPPFDEVLNTWLQALHSLKGDAPTLRLPKICEPHAHLIAHLLGRLLFLGVSQYFGKKKDNMNLPDLSFLPLHELFRADDKLSMIAQNMGAQNATALLESLLIRFHFHTLRAKRSSYVSKNEHTSRVN